MSETPTRRYWWGSSDTPHTTLTLCTDCGCVVTLGSQDVHDAWHAHIDPWEHDE